MSSSARKRSPIWKYFDVSSEEKKYAVCLLCYVRISRGGEGKKAGTTALKNHLKIKHPEEFQSLNNDGATVVSNMPVHPGPSLPAESNDEQIPHEISRRNFFSSLNDTITRKYHYLIAEMIVVDNEPISMVERQGFTRLLEHILPRYKIPSSTDLTENVIPDIYERIFEKIKRNILKAQAISVTSDVWTCSHNNTDVFTFTAHWVSSDFKHEQAFLTMKAIEGFHTDIIARELNSITHRWNIDQSKIHLLVHNSGDKMLRGVVKEEYNYSECFIDSLQRIINEALNTQSEVTTMIASARRFVTYFINSIISREILMQIQKELNLPQHIFVQDISTRWISTYYMLERLQEQKQAISMFVSEHNDVTNLMPEQWCLIEQYMMLLKPFEEITKKTTSGLSCISEVIPHVAAVRRYLVKDDTEQRTPELSQIRTLLKDRLENYFISLTQEYNYLIATALDPRFKTSYYGTSESERATQKIQFECIKLASVVEPIDTSNSLLIPSKRRRSSEDASVSHEGNNFWHCYDEAANDSNHGRSGDRDIKTVSYEIDCYLKATRVDFKCDPHSWWSTNARQYPNLATLSRIYLSAPCSVLNERLFSVAGLGYEEKRDRLLPLDEEKLVFIRHNLPLVNYEY